VKDFKAYAFCFPLVNLPKAADLKELSHLPEDKMGAFMFSLRNIYKFFRCENYF